MPTEDFQTPQSGSNSRSPSADHPTDPASVIRRFSQAWAAGDIDATMALIAENAVYTLHLDEDAYPFAGETRGKPAIRAALEQMRAAFDYTLYRPFPAVVDGNRVRHQVEFMYRHRATDEELTGRYRLVWTVDDGLSTSCQEYHDRARIEAFARLIAVLPGS